MAEVTVDPARKAKKDAEIKKRSELIENLDQD